MQMHHAIFREPQFITLQRQRLGTNLWISMAPFQCKYSDCDSDYTNKGVDQLEYVIQQLKIQRHEVLEDYLISAWNPCQLDKWYYHLVMY